MPGDMDGFRASDDGTDGPWRVAEGVRLIVVAGPSALGFRAGLEKISDLATGLLEAGFPLRDARLVAGEAVDAPAPAPAGVPLKVVRDVAAALPDAHANVAVDCVIVDGMAIEAAGVAEMRRVAATDPVIAIVVPRFDRDSLYAFPPAGGDAAFDAGAGGPILRLHFPAVTYAVLPDARCLYLKGSAAMFADALAGPAEPAWDRYALRLNRLGFRVAVANHALARIEGPALAGGGGPELGARILALGPAFPKAGAAMDAYLSAAPREAERLIAGLIPDRTGRLAVAFDMTHVGVGHSGTTTLARAIIARATTAWRDRFAVHVVARRAVFEEHFGGLPNRPARVEPDDPRTFAAFIRLGQPFLWTDLDDALRRAPALVFFVLDTIGFDCLDLAPDDLDAVWRFVFAEADGVLFNSAFTMRQFGRRFPLRADLPRAASPHSLDVAEYGRESAEATGASEAILLVGNAFAHKFVEETARMLAGANLGAPIVALGLPPGRVPGVTGIPSGRLDDAALVALFGRARVVVYPSVYEGFGFPVLEALSRRKPVLVRRLPPVEAMAGELPEAANIHFFDDVADLVRRLRDGPVWVEARSPAAARTWDDATADVREILEAAIEGIDYQRVLRRIDFLRGRLQWVARKRFGAEGRSGGAAGRDLDRLAALAGGAVEGLVSRAGRAPGSGPALRALLGLIRRGRGR